MGRIKTKQIKRLTMELMGSYGNEFTTDFSKNKVQVEKYTNIGSKKLRNTVAGYVTRLSKAKVD